MERILLNSMESEAQILLWWLLFGITHIGGSSLSVRGFLVRRLGLLGFKVFYSLVAFATFIPLCDVYFRHKHAGLLLFLPGYGLRLTTQVLMLLALIVLGQSLATKSPLTTIAEMTSTFRGRARGIQRITRHPQNFSFALFGFAHMLSNPFAGDWVFFGGFLVYGLFSGLHQDKRTLVTGPKEVGEFQAETSIMPFAAILAGKQRLALREFNGIALALSILSFVVLRYFHNTLFGGYL
jgi:uncharacterized membrane protein